MSTDDPTLPAPLRRLIDIGPRIGLAFAQVARAGTEGVTLRRGDGGPDSIEVTVGGARVASPLTHGDGIAAQLAAAVGCLLEESTARCEAESLVGDFCDRLSQSYEETYTLFRAFRLLASTDDPVATVTRLCADVQRTLPFAWIALAFTASPRVVGSLRGRILGAGRLPAEPLLEALRERAAKVGGDSWTKVLAPEDDPIARSAGGEVVCEPVVHDGGVIALLAAGGKSGADAEVATPEVQFLDATASFLGTYHENLARFDEQRAMTLATLEALVAAIDAKDRYTCGHSERVATLARAIADSMNLDPNLAERIRLSGLVHDVGKIGVPESILGKPGRPTDEEFAAIRRHPEIGHRILRGIVGFEDLLGGVLHHHERWDGRGYPHGLAAEAIPLPARIIGVADAFDAMSSTRAYRAAMPRESVLAELRKGAGAQFDPAVVAAFLRLDLSAYDALLARHAAGEAPSLRAAA